MKTALRTDVDHEVDKPRPRLMAIRLLPAAATLGNLLCGFAAIFCCLLSVRAEYAEVYAKQPHLFLFYPRFEQLFPTHIAAGAYLIVLAMVFDALDGRLARLTRRTSEFGAQLDSLSDIVSFGVAPIALFIALLMRPVQGSVIEVPEVSRFEFRISMVCGLVYLSCAAIRLARFNAENVKSEEGQRIFSGLPSPGAAATMAALLALHEHLRYTGFDAWGVDWPNIARWVLALTAFALGLLMISRFDYVHVFNVYARRRHPPTHLVWLVVVLGLGWYSFELLLVVLTFTYVISGLVGGLMRWWRGPAAALPEMPRTDGGDGRPRPTGA